MGVCTRDRLDRFALRSAPPVALLGRSTFDRTIVRLLPAVPRPVVQRLSARYIAGPTLDDAVRVVGELNAKGKLATVDVLGEEITSAGRGARDRRPVPRRAGADRQRRARREHLDQADRRSASSSTSSSVPRESRGRRAPTRRRAANFVRIDMEDSSHDRRARLQLYRELRDARAREPRRRRCRPTCGERSTTSTGSTTSGSARASTSSRRRSRIASSTRCARTTCSCLEQLVAQGAYVGIATHDEYLIGEALRIVARRLALATVTSSRCCSACGPTGRTSWCGRPSRARLRPVRHAVVRVLAAAAAGEPEDRRLRRRRHGRPACLRRADDAEPLRRGSEKPPSTISVWPRIIVGVRRAEERDRAGDVVRRRRAGRPGSRAGGEHLLAVREVLERARLDDAARDGVDADPAARARPRGSGRAPRARPSTCRSSDVVLEHALRAERRDRDDRRAVRHLRRRRRARAASSARAFAFSVQSQCLSSVSSAGRITPVAALWTSTSSGPSAATSSSTRSDVTLPRTSTGSAPSARSSSAVSSAARSLRR